MRVSAAGSKTFIIRYRIDRGGKQRWLSIGPHRNPWLVDDARIYARELLVEAATGHDPKAARVKRRGIPTIEEWAKTFLRTHGRMMKASSLATVEILVRRHIVPALGPIRLDQVRKEDVLAVYRKLAARGTPTSGNRVVATLHSLLQGAIEQGLIDENVAVIPKTQKHREVARKRFLSDDEWKRLGEAIEAAEKDGEDKFFLSAINC